MSFSIRLVIFITCFLQFRLHGEAVFNKDLHFYPVLIQIPLPNNPAESVTGTGVYMSTSNKTFLITADHVLFDQNSQTTFSLQDFCNLEPFVRYLKDAPSSDVLAAYLTSNLSTNTCGFISRFSFLSSFDEQTHMARALIEDINRLISTKFIYESNRFSAVHLSAETINLIAKTSKSIPELIWLNRMLLEDAFPAAITKDHYYGKPGYIRGSRLIAKICNKLNDDGPKPTLYIDLQTLRSAGQILRHPTHDVVAIQFGTYDAPAAIGQTNHITAVNGISSESPLLASVKSAFAENCSPFDTIVDGADAYILGYPTNLGQTASDLDFDHPILRKGYISQKNKRTGTIIIDGAVYHGNSGGPLFVVEYGSSGVNYKLAGIIVKYVGFKTDVNPQMGITGEAFGNSGYSVVEPIDYALQLIQ